MREELISLLEEAFEAGIITSTTQTRIDAIKKKINLTDAEYQLIEDQIRLDAYIRKVKEREKKGVTFMGDLRKQYKITEEDKLVIQEKLTSEPKKTKASKPAEPSKQTEAAGKQEAIAQPGIIRTAATSKQAEQAPTIEGEKSPVPSKKQDLPKKTEPVKQTEQSKKKDAAVPPESDVLKRSELLKQHQQMPETPPEPIPEAPKKQEAAKKQEIPKQAEPPKKQEPIKRSEPIVEPSEDVPVILVADDNETQLFLMKKIIEVNGYACITTDSPEAAVRIMTEKKPAIVFCDVNFGIGKPTGMDVFTNIRTKNIQTPFVLVSAFFQREFKDHAKRIGINDYITKPVDEDHLIATIKKYLARE